MRITVVTDRMCTVDVAPLSEALDFLVEALYIEEPGIFLVRGKPDSGTLLSDREDARTFLRFVVNGVHTMNECVIYAVGGDAVQELNKLAKLYDIIQ